MECLVSTYCYILYCATVSATSATDIGGKGSRQDVCELFMNVFSVPNLIARLVSFVVWATLLRRVHVKLTFLNILRGLFTFQLHIREVATNISADLRAKTKNLSEFATPMTSLNLEVVASL